MLRRTCYRLDRRRETAACLKPPVCHGKKLRIDVSFNYVETGQAGASIRGTKRGYTSVSQQMLSERAMLLDAEETSPGQPSIWRSVYNLLRCPGPPCRLGPCCWRDDVGKRHYRRKTHHLRKPVHFVEQGGRLERHEVPAICTLPSPLSHQVPRPSPYVQVFQLPINARIICVFSSKPSRHAASGDGAHSADNARKSTEKEKRKAS